VVIRQGQTQVTCMKVRVTTDRLNVRKGPGTQYDVVNTLTNGDIADTVDTTGWLPILLADNSIGWVSEKFVTDASTNIVKDICDECDRQGLAVGDTEGLRAGDG
jgi:uncharacterized protein YgiM (DUF1202 family)